MPITIVNYSPQYEKAHQDFVVRYWKRERARNPQYMYWKFRGQSPAPLKGLFLALDGEKVVGISGYIPFEVNIAGTVYEAHWTCDLMVDHEYRGKEVARLLYEEAKKNKIIIIGSAPSPAATKSLARAGFRFLPGSWKVSFPKNFYEVFKLKRKSLDWLKWVPNPMYYILPWWGKWQSNAFKPISAAEFADRFHATKKSHEIYTQITSSYQTWRFQPFLDYYPGVETFADDQGNYYAGYRVKSVYYLCDFHAKSFTKLLAMLGYILKRYSFKEIDIIRFMVNEIKQPKWMYWFGFIPFKTNTRIVYFTDNQSLLKTLEDKHFYYTYLDSDENI